VRWPTAVLAGVVLAVACGSIAADHEELGDRAYVAASYGDALTEYRLALLQEGTPSARLRAKAAAAARQVGDLEGAAREYLALARADETRMSEAVDGLERVARAAAAQGQQAALRAAVTAVRELAPDRPLTVYAGLAVQGMLDGGRAADVVAVLPAAAATAPDARQQDSLMFVYASFLARLGRCEAAVPVFEAVARRQRAAAAADEAERGAAACALRLGQSALDSGRPERADEWFRRAASQAGDSPIGRAAYLGLGDVRFARGDVLGAAEAYQRVLIGAAPGDSLANAARDRLNRIANAGTVFP
jgi:tetratricopeptide (TPR) repeat protein